MQETVRRLRYMIWLTFYVERVRAHRIKIIDHSGFHNLLANFKNETKMKTSLRPRETPGVSGALRSLRILRIGRIGYGNIKNLKY